MYNPNFKFRTKDVTYKKILYVFSENFFLYDNIQKDTDAHFNSQKTIRNEYHKKVFNHTFMENYSGLKNFAIVHTSSLNYCLEYAHNHGFENVFINFLGTILTDDFKLFRELENFSNNNDFLISGHIIDRDSAYIDPQSVFININKWKEVGSPNIILTEDEVKVNDKRPNLTYYSSKENFHDDYTPKFISSNPEGIEKKLIYWNQPFANFIGLSIENDLVVHNFNEEIRSSKICLYPYENRELLENIYFNKEYKLNYDHENYDEILDYFDGLKFNNIKNERHIFFLNNERYDPLEKIEYKINKFYSVSSGFKIFKYIDISETEPSDNVDISFFDISKPSLDFKQAMVTEWDGKEYHKFIRKFFSTYKNGDNHIMHTIDELESQYKNDWEHEVEWWGGEDEFSKKWEKFKLCKYKFLHIDLISEMDRFIEIIKTGNEDSLIYFSNIFHYILNVFDDENEIHYSFYKMLHKLKKFEHNTYIIGDSPTGQPLHNMVKEIKSNYINTHFWGI